MIYLNKIFAALVSYNPSYQMKAGTSQWFRTKRIDKMLQFTEKPLTMLHWQQRKKFKLSL